MLMKASCKNHKLRNGSDFDQSDSYLLSITDEAESLGVLRKFTGKDLHLRIDHLKLVPLFSKR